MKGICFKEPLFHATIEGRKTQTRRIITPQPEDMQGYLGMMNSCAIFRGGEPFKPRYKPGEVVYLKEPYCNFGNGEIAYKFDNKPGLEGMGWSNKLFMPTSAARYFIRITALHAERLQDISDVDCLREGIECVPGDIESDTFALRGWDDGYSFPKDAYAYLIDKINGRGTWDSNPWVWVYDYELANLKN